MPLHAESLSTALDRHHAPLPLVIASLCPLCPVFSRTYHRFDVFGLSLLDVQPILHVYKTQSCLLNKRFPFRVRIPLRRD